MRGSFLKNNRNRKKGLEKANSSKSTTSIKAERRKKLKLKDGRSESHKKSNSFIYISTIY